MSDLARSPLSEGVVLNTHYKITQRLGGGGFGITYEAVDTRTETFVAIKELFPRGCIRDSSNSVLPFLSGKNHAGDPDAMTDATFERLKERSWGEGTQLMRIKHRNIVPVFDVFEENNTIYIVMKRLYGETLTSYVSNGDGFRALPTEEAIEIITKLESPITYLHSEKILHRDIKPDNIMRLTNGTLVLIDFGGSREFFGHSKSYTSVHTHGFAPPEQYKGRYQATPAVDVYGVAATLYFLLTGEIPPLSLARIADEDDMHTPRQINPKVPEVVSNAIMRGMAPRAVDRFTNASDFVRALKGLTVSRSTSVIAPPPTMQPVVPLTRVIIPEPEPEPSNIGRNWLWGGGGVMVAIGLFLLGFSFVRPLDTLLAFGKEKPGSSPKAHRTSYPGRKPTPGPEQTLEPRRPNSPRPRKSLEVINQEIDRELRRAMSEGRDTIYCKCKECKCQMCECTPSNTRDSED